MSDETTQAFTSEDLENAKRMIEDASTYGPNPEQAYVTRLMNDFTDMRVSRAQLLGSLYDFSDPNVLAHIMGDMVTLLENMHIAMNPMPEDGFVSLTPKDDNGSDSAE